MVRDAVMTFVQLGDGDDRDLQVALGQREGLAQFHRRQYQVAQRRRDTGEDRHLVAKLTVAAGELFVDRGQIGGKFGGRNAANTGRSAVLTVVAR